MKNTLGITRQWTQELESSHTSNSTSLLSRHHFSASVLIPGYRRNICRHYKLKNTRELQHICSQSSIDMPIDLFGIMLSFAEGTELPLFDTRGVLDEGMRLLIQVFGVVVLQNAALDAHGRSVEHRARFKHLSFHRDRDPGQEAVYSLYSRSPYCKEQREPRTSSTLFMANIVAHLQASKESQSVSPGVRAHYELFAQEEMHSHIGSIVAEHAWNQPSGTGELSMLDNRTALHSSYYQNPYERGSYKIGVRYLS